MKDNQRIFVTGASGLLGSNVVKKLLEDGSEVVAFLRTGSQRLALKGLDCEIIEGELDNEKDLKRAIQGCDYVIHCAAKTDQGGRLKDYRRVNLLATSLLIDVCKAHKVKRFIYISTANCFTNGSLSSPGNEEGGFMPWLKKSAYAYSKYQAQQMVLEEARQKKFPALVLAPTFLIGRGDAKKTSGKVLLHGSERRIVFYPPGGKSFIDVEHAAESVVFALSKGRIGESYILAGENLSYQQFFRIIKQTYNPKAILIQLPHSLIRPVAMLGSAVKWLLPLPINLDLTNWRLISLDNYFTGQKGQQQLGLKQTNTEIAIKKAFTWYRENPL